MAEAAAVSATSAYSAAVAAPATNQSSNRARNTVFSQKDFLKEGTRTTIEDCLSPAPPRSPIANGSPPRSPVLRPATGGGSPQSSLLIERIKELEAPQPRQLLSVERLGVRDLALVLQHLASG